LQVTPHSGVVSDARHDPLLQWVQRFVPNDRRFLPCENVESDLCNSSSEHLAAEANPAGRIERDSLLLALFAPDPTKANLPRGVARAIKLRL
jgi:hypothetical protein